MACTRHWTSVRELGAQAAATPPRPPHFAVVCVVAVTTAAAVDDDRPMASLRRDSTRDRTIFTARRDASAVMSCCHRVFVCLFVRLPESGI